MTGRPDPWARFESPRAIGLIVAAAAVAGAAFGYSVGYDLGSRPPAAPTIVFEAGSIVAPALAPPHDP